MPSPRSAAARAAVLRSLKPLDAGGAATALVAAVFVAAAVQDSYKIPPTLAAGVAAAALLRECLLMLLAVLARASESALDDRIVALVAEEARHPVTRVVYYIAAVAATASAVDAHLQWEELAFVRGAVLVVKLGAGLAFAVRATHLATVASEAVARSLSDSCEHIRVSATPLVITLRYFTLVASLVFVAMLLGWDVGAAVAGLGVGGVAVAFAMQNVLQDCLAFAVLLLDRPFRVGCAVSVGGVDGTVEGIGLKSTRVRDFDGALHVFPNKVVGGAQIVNHTACRETEQGAHRAVLEIDLAYTTSTDELEQFPALATAAAEEEEGVHVLYCRLDRLTDYGFLWKVHFYVDGKVWVSAERSRALLRVVAAARRAGLRLSSEARATRWAPHSPAP